MHKLKLKTALTAFFIVYVVALSFIPVVHETLLAQSRWVGYGLGAYQCQSQNYFVLFNDPYDGSSKPHIHLNPSFAPAERISLVEFSDWTSYVNDHNLFNEFNTTFRTVQADPPVLGVTYTSRDIVLYKFIEVSPDFVTVTMDSAKEFRFHLELWKWVITSINGLTAAGVMKPIAIPPTTSIEFTFEDDRLQSTGHVRIMLSSLPVLIQAWPHGDSFNRITIDFVNSRMVFTVSGSMEATGRMLPLWNYTLLPYVLPIVAVAVAALYLLVNKYGRTLKNHATGRSS